MFSSCKTFKRGCLALAVSQALTPTIVQASRINVDAPIESPGDGCTLIEAVQTAELGVNINSGTVGGCTREVFGAADSNVINLPANSTQTLTQGFSGNPNLFTGLPFIRSKLSIEGNGSTIQRSSSNGTPDFRLIAAVDQAQVRLLRTTLTGGKVDNFSGGAVYAGKDSYFYGQFLTVTGNSAKTGGGIFSAGEFRSFNDTFSNNTASERGGAIYLTDPEETDIKQMRSSIFTQNSAPIGGAVSAAAGTLLRSLVGVNTFTSNAATQRGGAIDFDASMATGFHANFYTNSADTGGAVSLVNNSDVRIINSSFDSNVATTSGGAIDVHNSSLTLSNNSLLSNSATSTTVSGRGGAVHASSTGGEIVRVAIATTSFTGNTARTGGAVAMVSDNAATDNLLDISRSNFIENRARFGAAMRMSRFDFAIKQSLVSQNTAEGLSGSGGGINTFGSSGTLLQSTVSYNTAEYAGGGIYVNGFSSDTITLANSTLTANQAGTEGGGFYAAGQPFEILNSTLFSNTADLKGGGLYSSGVDTLRIKNSIFANSSGEDCAIYQNAGMPLNLALARDTIVEDGSCGTQARHISPSLGPLENNGGVTMTHKPSTSSPALGSGDLAVCLDDPVSLLDQRDEPRGTSACTVGAMEPSPNATSGNFFVVPLPDGKSVIFDL